ncbi:MAG: bifunctional precorrin-2 dehydrogenase/sirohydrochlorin ferrochelatase [Methanoregula sp.]|jgi:precorrin-2 dehydrogenase/sirohydrochlorin ferrochelatase|uniref:precorrin-2 dehydrogenase/sirohydrochlorin ferrochelatase family protein n=1 Tax=Methanoregula sp. TaxID=2052170 RepID=UPI003C16669C
MIPLFVECAGKQVVVFGGGEVAARKAAYFAKEAEVLMVSRTFSPDSRALPVQIQTLDTRTATDAELDLIIAPAFLVIGALSDLEENNRIGELCREHGVLFNSADGKPGDVIIPAMTMGAHYTIAISTGGESPAVSQFLRQEIEKKYPALDAMIALQHRLREALRSRKTTQAERRRILSAVLRDKLVWTLLGESPERAWERVRERYLHD